MVTTNAPYGYPHQPSEFAIDNKHSDFYPVDDEVEDLPSPVVFDTQLMSSPDAQTRRASLANSTDILSPADSQGWEHQYGHEIDPASAGPSHAFRQPSLRPNPPHVQTYVGQSHTGWTYEPHSGHVTPHTATGYGPPQGFPGGQPPPYGHPHMEGPQPVLYPVAYPQMQPQQFHGPPPQEAHFIPVAQVQPKSPHSHQDYMMMAQQEVEGRAASKRMRTGSPVRTSVDAQRQDGIRKKNGRIEIPVERDIHRIDELLQQEQNDDQVKELKQQKRLLRNREAALASRQRKKKHTEDLETQQKDCNNTISNLSHRLGDLEMTYQNAECQWHAHEQELLRRLEIAEDNQRRQLLAHNEETSTLRKRIQLLTEHVDPDPAPAMSAMPSSTGFTECNDSMELLSMEPHFFSEPTPWADMLNFDDHSDTAGDISYSLKPEPVPARPTLEKKSYSTNDATAQSAETTESSVGSGLLFFLLLCGALVASRPASSRPSDMPKLPDNVRAAAPAVLDNLLADPNLSMAQISRTPRRDSTLEPRSSPMSLNDMPLRTSRLGRIHEMVTAPTPVQVHDQAFALTSAQYRSISDPDFQSPDDHVRARSRNQPTLAEALAQSQLEYVRNSKAEVYTRSLLMDRIPANVVAQFREIVRDYNEIEALQQQQQANDDDNAFVCKIEP